ncbi:DUF1016 family protein [bacterium]|nr:DUF1016 family protein [bacterium]
MKTGNWEEAVARLKGLIPLLKENEEGLLIEQSKKMVLDRYQPIFSPPAVKYIKEDDFTSFLYLDNNRHWTGLYRKKGLLLNEFKKLKSTLSLLVDEEAPLIERLNKIQEDKKHKVTGLGRALMTAILLVVYPDRYGVWNGKSERGMKRLGIFPAFERGESFGSRYMKLNDVLLELKDELNIDLWTLDILWHLLVVAEEAERPGEERIPLQESYHSPTFGLERHLQDFLVDNWMHTDLSGEWEILEEDGELVGVEYGTDIGRIDLLCTAKDEKGWLVVELKRGQTEDATIGQVLRYMGWVQENLADETVPVKGLIICQEDTPKLRYALKNANNVDLMLYEVNFTLKKPDKHV